MLVYVAGELKAEEKRRKRNLQVERSASKLNDLLCSPYRSEVEEGKVAAKSRHHQ
jgi:hypothetical protein